MISLPGGCLERVETNVDGLGYDGSTEEFLTSAWRESGPQSVATMLWSLNLGLCLGW